MNHELPLSELVRAGFRVSSRVAGYIVVGVLFNLVLLFLFWGRFRAMDGLSVTTALRIGGLFIIVASPVIYYMLGARQGSKAAVHGLVRKYKGPLVHMLLSKILARFPDLFAGTGKANQIWANVRDKFDEVLGDNSLFLRMALRAFAGKVRFLGLAEDALGKFGDQSLEPARKLEKMAEWIAERIPEDRFVPTWKPLSLALITNVALVAAAAVL
ncbi:hypothetical protein KKC22_01420 [Myxococcota bacterium]|nr:hypothetical protein [Myxococcota bacterium]